jgi:membrane fusion protein, multidrug efflux system
MGENGQDNSRIEGMSQTTTATAAIGVMSPPPEPELVPDRDRNVDSQIVADPQGTRVAAEPHPAFPKPEKPKRHWVRWIVIGLVAAAIIGAGLRWGVPAVKELLDTVSTDDAFVQSHITYVCPRIEGLVTEVLVDQNDRVEPGTLLVRLDRQPFEVALAQAEASLEQSQANLVQARAQVRSQIAEARSQFYRRKGAQERLRQQVATLRAQVADLKARQSSKGLAEVDQRRLANLVQRGSATQAELDTRNNTLKNADEQVKAAWEAIQETRATLGLDPNYDDPLALPADLEQKQSSVQTSVSEIASALAQVGVPFDPKDADQAHAFNDFLRPGGDRSAGEGLEAVIEQAPAVQVARGAVDQSKSQVDNAKLRLSWTEIRSEIAGYVQDRSASPGNQVDTGQTLISIRPKFVWIAANYKETQISHIRIGQPVDLYVDAYPKRVFKGRVAGFSPGTGLSESLLPPENATGNYVKVTQRLPVRIELTEPNPDDTPLFTGLSVVPHVRIKERPSGPGAGERLHTFGRLNPPDIGGGPAGVRAENLDRAEDRRGRP